MTRSQEELVWEAMHGPDDQEVKLHVTGTARRPQALWSWLAGGQKKMKADRSCPVLIVGNGWDHPDKPLYSILGYCLTSTLFLIASSSR